MGLTIVTYNVCDDMDVLITLNIDPTLSQTVTLKMNFDYEVLART